MYNLHKFILLIANYFIFSFFLKLQKSLLEFMNFRYNIGLPNTSVDIQIHSQGMYHRGDRTSEYIGDKCI